MLVAILLILTTLSPIACVPPNEPTRTGAHSDHDGVPDHVEKELGLDPERADTDMDGLSDFQELTAPSPPQSGPSDSDQSGAALPVALVSVAYAQESTAPVGSDDATAGDDQTGSPEAPDDTPGHSRAETVGPEDRPAPHPAGIPEHSKPDWDAILAKHKALLKAGERLAANDPWRRGIAYDMTVNDVKNVHALASKRWSWSGGDIPTVDQYVAAFKTQLADDKTTPAPCLDEAGRNGGFINADPDLGGVQLTSAAQAGRLAQTPYANGGFIGYEYAAKIHNGLCDADGDGIPSFFEAYGYTLDQQSGLPGGLAAWGFKVTGSATYVVLKADGSHGPFWGAWGTGGAHPTPDNYYPGVVTGSGFEIVSMEKRDYTQSYLKTDAGSYNTDGDADTDDTEALGDASLAADRAPWNSPSVAGAPSFRVAVQKTRFHWDPNNVKFPDDGDWLDNVANVVTNAAPIVGTVLDVAAKIAPLVAEVPRLDEPQRAATPLQPTEGAAPKTEWTLGPSTAYAATSSTEPTGARASAMLSNLSNGVKDLPNIVGQVKTVLRLIWPKREQPIDWTRATAVDAANAGKAILTLTVVNDARVDAVDVSPSYTLMLGESIVGTYTCGTTVTLRRGGQPVAVTAPDATLDLDQLKAAMTGGSFSVIPNVGSGHLHKRIGNPLRDVDLGDWDGFRSDIDRNCATVIFDAGGGCFAQHQIAATHGTTVRDAFYECLRDYDRDGTFLGFALTNTDPTKEAKHFTVDDLRDWSVVFDSRIDRGSNKHYYWTDAANGYVNVSDPSFASSLDVPLVPRSVVQFVYKDRMNAKAMFADARMTYGSLKPNTSGGLDYKSVLVTLANRSECVSAIDVYFFPNGDTTSMDSAQKMQTNDDGVYTLELPKYQWTGKEKVLATLRGFDSIVKTDAYPVVPPQHPDVLAGYYGDKSGGQEAVYYALGSADPRAGTVTWVGGGELKSQARPYKTTIAPDAPSVAINQHGTAIMLYQMKNTQGLCKVGNVKWSRDANRNLTWSVDWGDEQVWEAQSHYTPTVDINGSGLVVEVHTDSANPPGLWSRAGVVDATAKTVSWGNPAGFDSGWNPDVTLGENGLVVQMHQGYAGDSGFLKPDSGTKLYIATGAVDARSKTVSWSSPKDTGWFGRYPTVSMNASSTLYEAHCAQSADDKNIWYTLGAVGRSGELFWSPTGHNWGDEGGTLKWTRIGLTDNGSLLEMHAAYESSGWGDMAWFAHYRLGSQTQTSSALAMPAGNGAQSVPPWSNYLRGVSVDIMP